MSTINLSTLEVLNLWMTTKNEGCKPGQNCQPSRREEKTGAVKHIMPDNVN